MKKIYKFALLIGTAGIIMFTALCSVTFNNDSDISICSDYIEDEHNDSPRESL